MMLDGILQQLRVGFQTESLHHFILVKSYRPGLEVEDIRDFFHRFTLCQQLQDFTLTARDPLLLDKGTGASQKIVHCFPGYER